MQAIVAGKSSKGNDFYRFEMTEKEFVTCDNDNEGLCVFCGETADGVEPDARKYACESCDKKGVYGMQELLLMGYIKFTE
jgi:hypothetical protein